MLRKIDNMVTGFLILISVLAVLLIGIDSLLLHPTGGSKVQVFKGDIVRFRWTPDTVFYSKTCTDYGTVVDQYGSPGSAYKIVVTCNTANNIEFVSLLIRVEDVVSKSDIEVQTNEIKTLNEDDYL